jgi:hypothetical protein
MAVLNLSRAEMLPFSLELSNFHSPFVQKLFRLLLLPPTLRLILNTFNATA